ncbi:MAG TPA: DUF502 domain-containing protein [Pseudomonadales bacterium]
MADGRIRTMLNDFIKPTLLGGVIVLLPAFLLFNILIWLTAIVHESTLPLVDFASQQLGLSLWFAQMLVLLLLIGICFVTGMLIRNRLGAFIVEKTESLVLNRFPGYQSLKELVGYFLSPDKKSVFSQPVLVCPWGNDTWMTGFLMDSDGQTSTVFVPTAPNPSTGLVLHVSSQQVQPLPVSGSDAFKNIIACGVGSASLLYRHKN